MPGCANCSAKKAAFVHAEDWDGGDERWLCAPCIDKHQKLFGRTSVTELWDQHDVIEEGLASGIITTRPQTINPGA